MRLFVSGFLFGIRVTQQWLTRVKRSFFLSANEQRMWVSLSDAAWVMKQEVTAAARTSCRCSPKVLRRQVWKQECLSEETSLLFGMRIVSVSVRSSPHLHTHHNKERNVGLVESPDFPSSIRRRDLGEWEVLLGVMWDPARGSLRVCTPVVFSCFQFVFSQRSFWSTASTPVLHLCMCVWTHTSAHTFWA